MRRIFQTGFFLFLTQTALADDQAVAVVEPTGNAEAAVEEIEEIVEFEEIEPNTANTKIQM